MKYIFFKDFEIQEVVVIKLDLEKNVVQNV